MNDAAPDSTAKEQMTRAFDAGRARGFLDAISSVEASLVLPLLPLITENAEAEMVVRRYEKALELSRQAASEVWAAHEARKEAMEA
ncbi:MAG TPA: hypothetical protein VKG38_16725 [Solirubrobacteraceae bacterium]|nr:hypothetical protein [Solirubrobacteraceae bacterium]